MSDVMEFVTLTTGSVTISRRADLTADTWAVASGLIAGRTVQGWSVSELTPVGCLVLHDGNPVSRCVLCTDAAAFDALWETAEPLAPPAVVLHRPRAAPWLAVALLPAALHLPRETLLVLPWIEVGVAWTLIGRTRP